MKSFLFVLLLSPFCGFSQTISISAGNTFSAIDWKYVYFDGSTEPFFTGAIADNFNANFEVEYLQSYLYSVTSYFGFFQSGGEIAEDEFHTNFVVADTRNRANNLSLGTNINIVPINNRFQLMLSFGPRLDYLIPHENSAMSFNEENLNKFYFGLSSGVGLFYNFSKWRLGIRGMYLYRFSDYLDVEPYDSNNWWENSTLGVRAKDRFIVNTQLVVGFNL